MKDTRTHKHTYRADRRWKSSSAQTVLWGLCTPLTAACNLTVRHRSRACAGIHQTEEKENISMCFLLSAEPGLHLSEILLQTCRQGVRSNTAKRRERPDQIREHNLKEAEHVNYPPFLRAKTTIVIQEWLPVQLMLGESRRMCRKWLHCYF